MRAILILLLAIGFAGCDSDDEEGTPVADATVTPTQDTSVSGDTSVTPQPDVAQLQDAAAPMDVPVVLDACGPTVPCDEDVPALQDVPVILDACGPTVPCDACEQECFSNHDCAEGTVCLDHDQDEMTAACCVPGERGALAMGEVCDPAMGQTTCASSICIEGTTGALCSDTCEAVEDCPEGMALCQTIAFSGSDAMWCFPAEPDVEPACQGDCFSNHDCVEGTVCLDHDQDEMTPACCFPGERGTLPAGEVCDPGVGEVTCASSICIDGAAGTMCSDTCETVEDCPEGMGICQFIAFSESDAMWCFPGEATK